MLAKLITTGLSEPNMASLTAQALEEAGVARATEDTEGFAANRWVMGPIIPDLQDIQKVGQRQERAILHRMAGKVVELRSELWAWAQELNLLVWEDHRPIGAQ